MKKKIYTDEDILNAMEEVETIESDGVFLDIKGKHRNVEKEIQQADQEILDGKVNFRMAKIEIERCKRIAAQKGLKYQSYIRSIIKQAMDRDEKASWYTIAWFFKKTTPDKRLQGKYNNFGVYFLCREKKQDVVFQKGDNYKRGIEW